MKKRKQACFLGPGMSCRATYANRPAWPCIEFLIVKKSVALATLHSGCLAAHDTHHPVNNLYF